MVIFYWKLIQRTRIPIDRRGRSFRKDQIFICTTKKSLK